MTWIERVEENCVEIFSPPLVRHWALFCQNYEDMINFRNETFNLVWKRTYFIFHLHSWVEGSFEKVLIQNQIANPALWNMGSNTKYASFYERLSLGLFSNAFLAELLALMSFCLFPHHCCCKMRFPGKSKEHTTKEETTKNYLEQSYFFRFGNISFSFWHPLPTFFMDLAQYSNSALTCHPTFLQGTAPPKVIEFMNRVTLVNHLHLKHL